MTLRPLTRAQIMRAMHPDRGRHSYGPALDAAIPLLLFVIGLIFARALPWLVISVGGGQ